MTIIMDRRRMMDSDEVKRIIQENTEFDVKEEISSRTKREDVLAFILECDGEKIKEDLEEEGLLGDSDEEYISEMMNRADEYGVEIEENLSEDLIAYYYAYQYDRDLEVIKTILVVSFDSMDERKLQDVGNRLMGVIGN